MKIKFDPVYHAISTLSPSTILIYMSTDHVMEIANNKKLTWVQIGSAGDV